MLATFTVNCDKKSYCLADGELSYSGKIQHNIN